MANPAARTLVLGALAVLVSAPSARAAEQADLYYGKTLDEYCSGILKKDASGLSGADRKACKDRYAKDSSELMDLDLDAADLKTAARGRPVATEADAPSEPEADTAQQSIQALGVEDLDGPAEGEKSRGKAEAPAATPADELGPIAEDAEPGDDEVGPVEDADDEPAALDEDAEDGGPGGDSAAGITLLEDDGAAGKSGKRQARTGKDKKKQASGIADRLEDDPTDLD